MLLWVSRRILTSGESENTDEGRVKTMCCGRNKKWRLCSSSPGCPAEWGPSAGEMALQPLQLCKPSVGRACPASLEVSRDQHSAWNTLISFLKKNLPDKWINRNREPLPRSVHSAPSMALVSLPQEAFPAAPGLRKRSQSPLCKLNESPSDCNCLLTGLSPWKSP